MSNTDKPTFQLRSPDGEVDAIFLDRWSPRAFSGEPIDERTADMLFEAARWAHSCNNDQPWHFVYGLTPEEKAPLLDLLVEKNREWARHASLVGFIVARKHFSFKADTLNRWAMFDCGAAWMALSLQARRLGLYTHGMGGFDLPRSYEALGIPEDKYEVICAFVVGRHGDPATLPEYQQKNEYPNSRKPRGEFLHRGKFKVA